MSVPANESPVCESDPAGQSGDSAEQRSARHANLLGNALLILGGGVVIVINLWLLFNMIMVEVLGIPRPESTAAVPYRDAVKGLLPYPTPWWVGALIVATLAGLLFSSWKREHTSTTDYLEVRRFVKLIVVIAAVFAVGCINLAMYYTPGDPLSPWHFIAVVAAGVTVVAHLRHRRMRRPDGVAITKSR
jgi:hypothetical protein